MRLRAIAVALVLPLGLVACGDDDGGITAREDPTTTREDSSDTTEDPDDTADTDDTTDTTDTTDESADTTDDTTFDPDDTTFDPDDTSDDTLDTDDTSDSDATIAPGVTKDDLIDQILASGVAQDREQAECFVDGILEIFTVEELAQIGASGGDSSEVFTNLSPEEQGKLLEIIGKCGLPASG